MKRIAIIPARGGSKRIPYKNIIEFNHRPMIDWTIKAALESGQFDRILVSTDDEKIAEVARVAGAEVPFLRENYFDDHATVSEATIAALSQAESYWGERYDEIVQLMPNCPLRTSKDILAAIGSFVAKPYNFQISAFAFGWMNPWWAMRINNDGTAEWLFADKGVKRSQDFEKLYCPTGAIWIASRDELLDARTFYGPAYVLFVMDWEASVDIDDLDDLRMAEAICYLRKSSGETVK